jgi:cell division protein ZapB
MPQPEKQVMAQFEDLAQSVDRLVVRHQELKRTSGLIAQQLVSVTNERDSLRSRLAAARSRIDALLARLPAEHGLQLDDLDDGLQSETAAKTGPKTGPAGGHGASA